MGADMISRRIIIVSVFKLIIYGLVIHELLRAARERDRRIHDLTIGTYAIAALVFLVRLIDAARPSTPEWEPLTPDVVQQLTFLTVFLTTFAASMLYVLMAGQEVNSQLYRLATFDGLTGIYNRRAFEQLARKELSRGNRSGALPALIIFDIDDFKGINDRLGHVTGDQVLREVIDSIQSALRQQDILGRWGGDEFCALLPETSLETARAVAERLRERVVQTPREHHGQRLQLTVSAGLAAAVRHDGSFTALVGRAGQALHEAKRSGRNRTCVAPQAEPRSSRTELGDPQQQPLDTGFAEIHLDPGLLPAAFGGNDDAHAELRVRHVLPNPETTEVPARRGRNRRRRRRWP